MAPDLEKLRRFSLAAGLILIGYIAAGVELEAGARLSVLGVPFIIRRPELLPLCLALTSIYGLARFYFYGFMLARSPQRHRKDLLHKLHGHGRLGIYRGSVFIGPTHYSTTPSIQDRAAVEAQLKEIISAFPKVWRSIPSGTIEQHWGIDDNDEPYFVYNAEVTIPFASRAAALLQDLDYSAPVWLNVVALGLSVSEVIFSS